MKKVLVTGGSRGLGLALCRALVARQWVVATCSRSVTPELEELLRAHPGRLEHYPVDFADPSSAVELAKRARVIEGLDGFVSNAGVGVDGLLTLSSEEAIRKSIEINLTAPMLLAREAIKGMLARGGGSLVFVSSVAAKTGLAGLAAYSAAKGGLVSFSRALAREYGERGIRSNSVLPGFLDTEMTRSLEEADRKRIANRTALKRLGAGDDPVGAIQFLLSDDSAYITGTEIIIDGGMIA